MPILQLTPFGLENADFEGVRSEVACEYLRDHQQFIVNVFRNCWGSRRSY